MKSSEKKLSRLTLEECLKKESFRSLAEKKRYIEDYKATIEALSNPREINY